MDQSQRDTLLREAHELAKRFDFVPACEKSEQVVEARPDDVEALAMHSWITYMLGSLDVAERTLRKLLTLRENNADDHYNLASVLTMKNEAEEAMRHYEAAHRLNPGSFHPVKGMAELMVRQRRHDEARELVQAHIAKGMDVPDLRLVLGTIHEQTDRFQEALEAVEPCAGSPSAPPALNRQLFFLMGRALEKLERYDDAFQAFSRGNTYGAKRFDRAWFSDFVDRLIATFTKKKLRSMPTSSNRSELPVFVTSMPRSGSTLVERIIGSHSCAVGVGEINVVNHVALRASEHLKTAKPYPECIEMTTRKGVTRLGEMYLEEAEKLSEGLDRVVDKTLQTWQHIGLVRLALPGAQLINVRRDPMDTCLSCFMAALNPDVHAFASNFEDLGFYYREYDRLMKHWIDAAEIDVLEVQYEELVGDPEGVSAEIIEHCDLEWEDECLRFHKKSDRMVMTLSYDQVRRPIYTSAMARWKKYERHLGPLKAALGDLATQ